MVPAQNGCPIDLDEERDSRRVHTADIAALLLAARNGALVVTVVVTAALGWSAARAYPTTDLFCFVTASRLVAEGSDPYDEVVWATATAGEHADYRGVMRPSPCPGRFGYPLWTALTLLPLAWLDDAWVGAVWQILIFAGTAIGVASFAYALGRVQNAFALGLAVAASQPFWLTVLNAQFGGILLGAVGASAAFAVRQKDLAAGASLALGWLKPHVVALALLAIPFRTLRTARPRVALAVVAVLAIGAAVSIVVRPAWPMEYATELLGNRTTQALASTSLHGVSSALTGSPLPGIIAELATIAVAVALLRGRQLADVELLAAAIASSLVLSPYLGSHDQLLLAPAWAVILARAGRGAAVVTALAVVLPWTLYNVRNSVVGPEGLNGLVPAITLVVLALVLRGRTR